MTGLESGVGTASWPSLERARQFIADHEPRSDIHTLLIVARAFDKGLSVSVDSQQRIELGHADKTYRLSYSRTNYNRRFAIQCTRQKEVTSRILRHKGLPAPENAVFVPGDAPRAWRWARQLAPVVVKPHAAQSSEGVVTDLRSKRDFIAAFDGVAAEFGDVLVERQVKGAEYRVVVIDGEYVAACRRLPPNVVGDGSSTIAELATAKNMLRAQSANLVHESPIVIDDDARRYLAARRLKESSVPAAGMRVPLRATPGSATSGGDRLDETDVLAPDEIELALRAVAAFSGLRVAGLDLMLPREDGDDEAMVLEINDHPGFAMHYFPWEGSPRDPAGRMLDAMFGALPG